MFVNVRCFVCNILRSDFAILNKNVPCRFISTVKSDFTNVAEDNCNEENTRILKVAIIGVPNVGKSTLLNQILNRNVFGVSSKVHTTRCKARGVLIQGNVQVVFLDTPGVVSPKQSAKFHLESSFLTHAQEAINEADIIGVMHDSSNEYTRHRLDSKILRLLLVNPEKDSFLILNKVDIIKSKRHLLDLSRMLSKEEIKHASVSKETLLSAKLRESEISEICARQKGWPYFKDIFMVSGLTGNGVGDIKVYLINQAKPGKWMFSESDFTDQNRIKMVEHIVRCKLLDNLPNEIAYTLSVMMEYYNEDSDDAVIAVVLIGCDTPRLERVVMGASGCRIKAIAKEAEHDLRNFFFNDVRLKLVVTSKVKYKIPTRSAAMS